jgi:transketolase
MSFKITNKKESIRDGLGRAVAEMDLDPDIVVVVADLGKSIGLDTFSDNTRYIECGIAEANMVTVATGIALSGKKAICGSFASFIPNRAYDQIRTSVCIENANVKLVGGHGTG